MKNNIEHNNPPEEVGLTDGEIIILDNELKIKLNDVFQKDLKELNYI